jgi:hypothetical protein
MDAIGIPVENRIYEMRRVWSLKGMFALIVCVVIANLKLLWLWEFRGFPGDAKLWVISSRLRNC